MVACQDPGRLVVGRRCSRQRGWSDPTSVAKPFRLILFNRVNMPEVVVAVKESAIETELMRRVDAAGGVAEKVTLLGRRGFYDRLVVLPGVQLGAKIRLFVLPGTVTLSSANDRAAVRFRRTRSSGMRSIAA